MVELFIQQGELFYGLNLGKGLIAFVDFFFNQLIDLGCGRQAFEGCKRNFFVHRPFADRFKFDLD